jgi:hypothetical protein
MTENMTTEGPALGILDMGEIIESFAKQVLDMAKMAVPTMVRGFAMAGDPCYQEMKKLNNCDSGVPGLSAGLTWGSVKTSEGYEQEFGKYAPINIALPIDIAKAAMDPSKIVTIYRNKDQYGKLITPFGILGLAMPELKGEEISKIRKQCPEGEIPESPESQEGEICDCDKLNEDGTCQE